MRGGCTGQTNLKEHCNDWRAGERQSWPPEGPGRVRESQAAMTQGGPGEPGGGPGQRGKGQGARDGERSARGETPGSAGGSRRTRDRAGRTRQGQGAPASRDWDYLGLLVK